MAKISMGINADTYDNCDAIHEVARTIENDWEDDQEKDKVDKEIKGKHFTAHIKTVK